MEETSPAFDDTVFASSLSFIALVLSFQKVSGATIYMLTICKKTNVHYRFAGFIRLVRLFLV